MRNEDGLIIHIAGLSKLNSRQKTEDRETGKEEGMLDYILERAEGNPQSEIEARISM